MIEVINDLELINFISKNIFNIKLNKNPYSKVIVYKENSIIGFCYYDLIYDRAEIEYIGILKEYRNKKIASKLMKYLIEDCKKNNIKNISLEVSIENISAIKLYEKFDFKTKAIRKKYYNGIDAYLMVKEVGD